jgi:mono/diheme cytochrome c family protein
MCAAAGSGAAASSDPAVIERGEYVFHAGGCYSCHTDVKNKGKPLAGARALVTPFGTFYSPNITPDPTHGIGAWTDEEFVRALRSGISPEGAHYFPAFPYTSYTGMADRDMLDLKAYLFAQQPVARPNKAHDLSFPFGLRPLVWVWKLLFFEPGVFVPDPTKDDEWNRGAYLVRHLGHCGQCHTPRNALGARERDRELAGNPEGPEGKKVPNITPHREDGIGDWSESDITFLLKAGFLPDGDFVTGPMSEVVDDGTRFLTDGDRAAIARYLMSLPRLPGP